MIDCVSVDNMRLSDQQTIEACVPGVELIFRAASAVFHAVNWRGKVAILTGSGNNGADGFALACILNNHKIDTTVYSLSHRMHQDCTYYAKKAEELGVIIQSYAQGQDILRSYDIVVDCLLGTGFQGNLRDTYRYAIEEINASAAYVVSVDINSGMNGDTGEASSAVRSDLTVTIEFIKNGLVTENAGHYMKRLVYAPIGIQLARGENKICDEREWQLLCEANGINVHAKYFELSGCIYYRCPEWLEMEPVNVY